MKIDFSNRFLKHLQKTSISIQLSFKRRLQLFIANRGNPLLRDHSLRGEWSGFRSINITGDWRAIYHEMGENKMEWIEFVEIGTHSELYE